MTCAMVRRAAACLALVALSAGMLHPTAAAEPKDWQFDVIRLKTGWIMRGLIVKETPAEVWFQDIRRKPGRPTVKFFTRLSRREIDRIYPLTPKEREVLAARVNALDPTGKMEDKRMQQLVLQPAYWGEEKKEGLSYSSDHFHLISNAPDPIVRRAVVRLEQIYAAYTHYLPPVRRPLKPNTTTTILLLQSISDYQAILKEQGRNIFNAAFYDGQRNEIVCASELQKLGRQLEAIRQEHDRLRERLRKQEMEVSKLPRGEVRERGKQQLAAARREIARAGARNEELFQLATKQLFRTLYHEAFHAYLANFVYPPGSYVVPRWLNEGLAQIFETAIVEAGELRVGHADPVRLEQVKKAIQNGELISLKHLLHSGSKKFIVDHARNRRLADRHYLTSWALAHYLTFERRVLGTKALDTYLVALTRDADPVSTFSALVGQPPAEFEKDFHDYMLRLKPDGSLAKQ